jgi:hypothetical protein
MTPSRHRIRVKSAVAAAALVATSLVWSGGTFSAFDKSSSMPGNSVSAASVALSDDDAGGSILTLAAARPGDATSGCVTVTYTGTAPAAVRLYGTTGGTGLATYLNLVVTRGTISGGGSAGSCTGFTADAGGGQLYSGTLASFPSSSGSAVTDASSWTSGTTHAYRFTLTLPSGTGAGAQGLTASPSFTWMAVSS